MRRAAFAAKSAVMMRSDRRALRDMVHAERLPARELAELTDRRTTELVLHAYRTVPYYRDRFTALRDLWVALRASIRSILEETTIDDLVRGRLPDDVQELLMPPDVWHRRGLER